ncbi:putative pantetheine hydrolase [Humibacillus xanthopallidus]|uniref:Putative pantetheine hydrolase n=1 Tax=Humibacillus xanthopallidus TaxID=412689 RepID=A0A543PQY1_9MICO|nr:P1 family peptidase [Humibacillus xanthopallidus]TQN46485.1 putative pantetheine hydrolase [Humibacillus xanthopallidus]
MTAAPDGGAQHPAGAGPTNSLVDVAGIRVGHHTREEPGWLTGVTVVVAPAGGAVAGVDVRGGGPGTRETDLLDPRNLVDRVDAVVLGGGSAFGLAAADGVMDALAADGRGWPMADPPDATRVVPIVPAAILFDLGRGGSWANRPRAEDGRAAYAAATDAVAQGSVGAGTGAKAGGLRGGVGSASVVLPSGATVAALVVVNAVGSAVDLETGLPYAVRLGLPGELGHVRAPSQADLAAAQARSLAAVEAGEAAVPGLATTIGVIATDATLTKAQCQKMAGVGHDGLARAVRPVHTLFDGDTLFALATGSGPSSDPVEQTMVMEAGADCVARAVVHAMLAATSVDRTADGGVALRSWSDAFPSALT